MCDRLLLFCQVTVSYDRFCACLMNTLGKNVQCICVMSGQYTTITFSTFPILSPHFLLVD
jgi:hypothetical protein